VCEGRCDGTLMFVKVGVSRTTMQTVARRQRTVGRCDLA